MAQIGRKACARDLPSASRECGRRGVARLLADTTTSVGAEPARGTTRERTSRGPDRDISPNPATTVNFIRGQGGPRRHREELSGLLARGGAWR